MRLFVDNLTNVDFSYLCPERGLVGETWLAHVELEGPLDEQGMVCDFGIVKKHLRTWLDSELDHRLLVATHNKHCTYEHTNEQIAVQWQAKVGPITTSAPAQAITLIDKDVISEDSVARWCEEQLAGTFGEGVTTVKLRFTAEQIEGPFYHYSHGLKKHLGNCQRIAHGHRSRLHIWKNGEYDTKSVNTWAEAFRDIYLGTVEDLVTANDLAAGENLAKAEDIKSQEHDKKSESLHFKYLAQQGRFTLSLPKSQCYLMDTDTTVEFIAQHIAKRLKDEEPESAFKVQAFEGIGKGAIAEV